MTHERFEALAETYGGDVARWPMAEREAAALLMAAEPAFARRVLAQASDLDAALDDWRPLTVSHELRERILETAPRPRIGGGLGGLAWRTGIGAGLAAACAAGLALGVGISDQVSRPAGGAEAVSAASDYEALVVAAEEA